MMSKKSKAEVIAAVREHYWKAKKAQKSRILDELIATTGYITNMRLTCCAMRNEGRALRNQAGRKSIVGMSSRFWNKSGNGAVIFAPNVCNPLWESSLRI